jgi:sigma-B regulation protein RsbU (phosphoserine phosphatase)
MDFSILTQLNVLLQLICVIIVAAYLLTQSRIFPEILDGHPAVKTRIILGLLFGALSVYGTVSGIDFLGSVVNVRGAGLIGAAYRFSMGGLTVYSCSVTAVFAGLFGGLIWLHQKRKFAGTTIAVIFAILMEVFHMVLTLAIARPFDAALAVVNRVYIPMILANAIGMYVFCVMVGNIEKERKLQAERDALVREKEQ